MYAVHGMTPAGRCRPVEFRQGQCRLVLKASLLVVTLAMLCHAHAMVHYVYPTLHLSCIIGPWYGPCSGQIYLPAGRRPDQTFKVIVALHGAGMEGSQMIGFFSQLADRHQIMLIAPDSSKPLHWCGRIVSMLTKSILC